MEAADYGIWAETPDGNISITQAGQLIAAEQGIVATTENGNVTVTNAGTTTATGTGIALDGTTNLLENTGTISAGGSGIAAITTGDGNSTIHNSGTISASDIAVQFGNGTNALTIDTATSLIEGRVIGGTGEDSLVLETGSSDAMSLVSIGAGGQFQNFEKISKTGLGTLSFTGDSSGFSGETFVSAGRLAVNGNNGLSATTVLDGATLAGTGSVGATTLQAGATIAPGNSIGTLTVNGHYTQAAGANYTVELAPGTNNSDRIAVIGAATIDAGATLSWSGYTAGVFVPNTRYTILTTTNGITGTFSLLGSSTISSFYDLLPTYDANNAYLQVMQSHLLAEAANTSNQRSTGLALDELASDNALRVSVSALQSFSEARAAFDALSGEAYASIQTQIFDHARVLGGIALDRLAQNQNGIWSVAHAGKLSISGDGNAAAMSGENYDLVTGVDNIWNDWRYGVMLHGGQQQFSSDRATDASMQNFGLGGYAGASQGNTAFEVGMDLSYIDIDANRTSAFNGFSQKLMANYSGLTGSVFGRLSHTFSVRDYNVTPYGEAAFIVAHTGDFAERGGIAALNVDGTTSQGVASTLGAKVSREFTVRNNSALAINFGAGWEHNTAKSPETINSFAGGAQFVANGSALPADAFVTQAGMNLKTANTLSFNVSYEGSFSGAGESHSAKAGFSKSF